jgi:hypothetical protein
MRPVEETGGTTFIAGGVLTTGIASRSWLPGRMMRLERFTGLVSGASDAGLATTAARMGMTAAGRSGASSCGGVASTAGGVAGAGSGNGGWKSRADLRSRGSTGGVMTLDLRAGSDETAVGADLTSAGDGGRREADLRMIGSTGGTIGVDFFAVSGGGIVGAPGDEEEGASGAGGGVMVPVLGIIGSDAVGELTGGVIMPERRTRGARVGGFTDGVAATGAVDETTTGGGTLGIAGGRTDGAMIGADFAIGSGMFGAAAGDSPSGGVKPGADEVCDGETSGGCGASVSGTRAGGRVSARGSSGSGVRAVSLRPDSGLRGMPTVSLVIIGSVPVAGSAGGRLLCCTGSRVPSISVLPLTKTLACGFAMMTRGGTRLTRPVAVGTRPVDVGTRPVPTGSGGGRFTGAAKPGPGRSMAVFEADDDVSEGARERGLAAVGSTSGSVFAREPVSEADCLICDGVGATRPVGGRAGFCIGWVTAVDHAGVTPCDTGAPIRSDDFSGIVAAVPEFGRESWVESGLSGRGGSVTRNVSRFWLFGSAEGVTSSAIGIDFYRYFGK